MSKCSKCGEEMDNIFGVVSCPNCAAASVLKDSYCWHKLDKMDELISSINRLAKEIEEKK